MPTTDIVGGTAGAVTASGFNVDLTGWSASLVMDTVAYRVFSAVFKKSAVVAAQLTGSFTGVVQFDGGTTVPIPPSTPGSVEGGISSFEGVTMVLTATTGCTFSFNGTISQASIERNADGVMTATYNFESDGDVTTAWDES